MSAYENGSAERVDPKKHLECLCLLSPLITTHSIEYFIRILKAYKMRRAKGRLKQKVLY